jgi:hypothetical protein
MPNNNAKDIQATYDNIIDKALDKVTINAYNSVPYFTPKEEKTKITENLDIDPNTMEISKEKANEEIINKIYDVLGEFDKINKQLASWDEWEKTKIIEKAKNILIDGFEDELIKREYENK